MTKINMIKVETYELPLKNGKKLLLKKGETWHGYTLFNDQKGRVLIASLSDNWLKTIFFDNVIENVIIHKCDKSLLEELLILKNEGENECA